jgi:hypothetical protein
MPEKLAWEGMQPVFGVLHNISKNVTNFLTVSMMDLSIDVFNLSQHQVPVDTGYLRASGSVSDPEVSPSSVEVNVGYSAPYALWVHEDLAAHHTPPGKAKFLEDPFNTVLGNLNARLEGRVEGAVVGQWPQAPAQAVHAQTVEATKMHRRRMDTHRGAMTFKEIDRGLKAIREGHGGWLEHGMPEVAEPPEDASWYTKHKQRSAEVRRARHKRGES